MKSPIPAKAMWHQRELRKLPCPPEPDVPEGTVCLGWGTRARDYVYSSFPRPFPVAGRCGTGRGKLPFSPFSAPACPDAAGLSLFLSWLGWESAPRLAWGQRESGKSPHTTRGTLLLEGTVSCSEQLEVLSRCLEPLVGGLEEGAQNVTYPPSPPYVQSGSVGRGTLEVSWPHPFHPNPRPFYSILPGLPTTTSEIPKVAPFQKLLPISGLSPWQLLHNIEEWYHGFQRKQCVSTENHDQFYHSQQLLIFLFQTVCRS